MLLYEGHLESSGNSGISQSKNKTPYIFYINVKVYIRSSSDDTVNLFYHFCTNLSPLAKIYCLYSEILYIFDYF